MFIFLILAIVFFILWLNGKKRLKTTARELSDEKDRNSSLSEQNGAIQAQLDAANTELAGLVQYHHIVDAKAEAEKIVNAAKEDADRTRSAAKDEADITIKQAREKAQGITSRANKLSEEANAQLNAAAKDAERIRAEAETEAKKIAGDAYEMAGKAKEYAAVVTAMKNAIEGYGDEYLKPTYSILDELAEDFGFTEAGQKLKAARDASAAMVKAGLAAKCDYVEDKRKNTAIAFVIDAFNGKVDSILSKTKKDNYGKMEQKIKDAYVSVNYNGSAFRNAVITPEYLSARLEELKWAVIVMELKAQAQEEQRRIREQIREEEKARREYEKAMKEAAKEEEMLRKAMEKAQKQIESATEANRAEYEAKLEELKQKLVEAEERGQRALSMAQQTRHGNVYVISNIGAFGENVYKVGMTRRLDPLDRIKELGDASVPFPFDVHAIIESDDAPALETALHKDLAIKQMNKVNPRKEFFKVTLADIKALVDRHGLKANWTMSAEAAEYRETLAIEEAMNNDPDARRRWEEYNSAVSYATVEG